MLWGEYGRYCRGRRAGVGSGFAGEVFGGGQGGSSCEAVRVKTAVTCEVEGSFVIMNSAAGPGRSQNSRRVTGQVG